MITKDDVERPGTIRLGDMAIQGQVHAVEEENELFVFNTPMYGLLRLDANQWEFDAPTVLRPGWYETIDMPVAKGGAPWWVDSEQVAHSFFVHENAAAKVSTPLTGRHDLIKALRPLEQ